jgi:putative redox protein
MPARRATIETPDGETLAAIVEAPDNDPIATAVFAHCFTCTKDLKAIVKISRRLADNGIAVVRFDFRGLGSSSGVFAESNFETNLEDLQAACRWANENVGTSQLLIGHSLGGAAVMASAMDISSVQAIATLAAPSCTAHLADFLAKSNPDIDQLGQGEVVIGGITHTISRQMLESMRHFDLKGKIESIDKPHLILHSPSDATVKFEHANRLQEWSNGETSLITLNQSDHLLLNRRQDVNDVADLISVWARHWIEE